MLLNLLLMLMIPYVWTETDNLTNATLQEIQILNDLEYSHESTITGLHAEFSFKINLLYARNILNINSYYISITFIDEKRHEERTALADLPSNENVTVYNGHLIMKHLEEEGNYLICVFFLNDSSYLIGSSRFCHVVSIAENCLLEVADSTITNQHVYVLLIFAVGILLIVVIFSIVRDYVNRPKTSEDILRTLQPHIAKDLEKLADEADTRRRRRTQPELNDRLREDSVITVEYDPNTDNTDNEYHRYHGYDNLSLDTVIE